MKILFVGPNSSEFARATHHGDVAASRWANGLLSALSGRHEIMVLTHIHERPWPLGECFWRGRDDRYLNLNWPCEVVPYPAICKLRWRYLAWAYPYKARKLFRQHRFDAVVLYNCLDAYSVAVMREAKKAGIPSFPIILDGDDPRRDNWSKILADTKDARGVVFLSHWAAVNFPSKLPRLHLDGGADRWNGQKESPCELEREPYLFVHTGALDKWRGLDFMKEVVRLIDGQNLPVRILLCGRILPEMRNAFAGRRCVEMKGFVTDDELTAICQNAFGFLNVRDPKVGDNILNYPSKIPHCLSYGKPIVSTWIDSFSPDYRGVLAVDASNSPSTFVDVIKRQINQSKDQLRQQYDIMKSWFNMNKLWTIQAQRLALWIEGLRTGVL